MIISDLIITEKVEQCQSTRVQMFDNMTIIKLIITKEKCQFCPNLANERCEMLSLLRYVGCFFPTPAEV
jgi:hypothetical protein